MSRADGHEATWSFVQMNMTLLPIARPLPVSVAGRKPRTPTQKLHDRVLRSAAKISPRHHDESPLRRRGSTASEHGTAASCAMPRHATPERQYSAPNSLSVYCGKRKSADVDQSSATNDESRGRSCSEDLTRHDSRRDSLDATLEKFMLTRSASTSSALAQRGPLFKDKRILEIQDEERRLHPDERATLPSPSKRSRRV